MKPRNRLVSAYGYPAPNGAKRSYYRAQIGWDSTTEKHKKPFPYSLRYAREQYWEVNTLSTAFTGRRRDVSDVFSLGDSALSTFAGASWITGNKNRAYARMVGDMKGEAESSLGAFIAEGGEALRMLFNRLRQAREAWKALRRLDLPKMFDVLGFRGVGRAHPNATALQHKLKAQKRQKLTNKEASGVFLEVSYGWLPALGDMADAMKVLGSEPYGGPVKGSCKGIFNFVLKGNGSNVRTLDFYGKFKQGCTAAVSNPNVVLLNQLGVINPVAIGWELAPFSFLVDQVVNIQQMAESWTDFAGFTTTDHWQLVAYSLLHSEHYAGSGGFGPSLCTQRILGDRADRTLGAYRPQLYFEGAFGFVSSMKRLANNAALVLQLWSSRR